ncbi:SPla/RYanodine receptor (SPRY) domain-containing protein [Striga asiatica]|uniref:SPla/RYanodine receptor (SPRY) domain-containing protein n=1 Tax=Striga asiatica TaxID=4170 RepID=A0A5A7P4J5_STRAF|nr:SPla/RYanodine receptor (SPRY) domain-containing protein [Striga asiatica]
MNSGREGSPVRLPGGFWTDSTRTMAGAALPPMLSWISRVASLLYPTINLHGHDVGVNAGTNGQVVIGFATPGFKPRRQPGLTKVNSVGVRENLSNPELRILELWALEKIV